MNKEERHYNELISYFKNLVLILGTLIGLFFTFFTFIGIKSTKERNEEIEEVNKNYRDSIQSLTKSFYAIIEKKADSTALIADATIKSKVNIKINDFFNSDNGQAINKLINDELINFFQDSALTEKLKERINKEMVEDLVQEYIKKHPEIFNNDVVESQIADAIPKIFKDSDNIKNTFNVFSQAFSYYLQIKDNLERARLNDLNNLRTQNTEFSDKFENLLIEEYQSLAKTKTNISTVKEILSKRNVITTQNIDNDIVVEFLKSYKDEETLMNQAILYCFLNQQGIKMIFFSL